MSDIEDILIPAVSAAIARYCGRTFEMTEYVELSLRIPGGNVFYLPNYPVEVDSITLLTYEDEDLLEGMILEAESGRVELERYLPVDARIVASYKAGYDEIPADLSLIATRMVADLVAESTRDGGLKSESLADHSWTAKDVESVLDKYKAELEPFRRIPIG